MADDTSEISNLNNSSQTLSGQTEWVTFSEHDQEPIRVESTAKERPPEENGRYLSRLGELKESENLKHAQHEHYLFKFTPLLSVFFVPRHRFKKRGLNPRN